MTIYRVFWSRFLKLLSIHTVIAVQLKTATKIFENHKKFADEIQECARPLNCCFKKQFSFFRPSPHDRPKPTENVRCFPSHFIQIESPDDDTWNSIEHAEKTFCTSITRNLVDDGRLAKSAFRISDNKYLRSGVNSKEKHRLWYKLLSSWHLLLEIRICSNNVVSQDRTLKLKYLWWCTICVELQCFIE